MKPVIIGNAELYYGPCEEVLPLLCKVDAVITDPPYGIGASEKKFTNGNLKQAREHHLRDLQWDATPPPKELIDKIVSMGEVSLIWGGNYFDLPPSRCFLIWDKTIHGNSYADCEYAWTNQNANARIKALNLSTTTKDGRVHPTQKPLELMQWCIAQCKNDPISILDPFMGSGTTGVAAVQLGRKFIGIERDERYFEVACKRIERAVAQGRLFEPEPIKQVQDSLL